VERDATRAADVSTPPATTCRLAVCD